MMVTAATALLSLLALVVAGCATPETVMMRNRQTGEIAQCVAAYRSLVDGLGYRQQGDCIADYEGKGFERDLAPAGEK
jgi:hypothetical protein